MKRRTVMTLVCAVWCPAAVFAQGDTTATSGERNWQVGGAIMFPGGDVSNASFAAVGLTATSARPNRIGPDLAFVLVPRSLQGGALLGGIRANIGLPVTISPTVTIVPSAGASFAAAVGAGGTGGARGWNGTLALLLFRPRRDGSVASVGLRVAISEHQFSGSDFGLRLFEIGFVRR